MLTHSSTIYDFSLEKIWAVLLYSDGFVQVKKLIQSIVDGETRPSHIDQRENRENNPLEDLSDRGTEDSLSWYIKWSDIYDRIDTSNNTPHDSLDGALPRSPYFLSVIEILQSGILQKSTDIADIIQSPWVHTLRDLVTALKSNQSAIVAGVSNRERRKYQVRISSLLRTIEQDNILLAAIQSHYYSLLEAAIVPSLREKSDGRNQYRPYKDNGLIIESSFDFFTDEYRLSDGDRSRKWCLHRSMGRNAQIWYWYIFWSPPSFSTVMWRQEEIESVIHSRALKPITSSWSEWIRGMRELSHAFDYYRSDDLDSYDSTGYLWCYVQGIGYRDDTQDTWETRYYDWEYAKCMVKDMFDNLAGYLKSYKEFIILCVQVPAWKERSEIILAYLIAIEWYLSPEFLLGWYAMDDFSNNRDPAFKKISAKIRKRITSSYTLLASIIYQLEREWLYFIEFAHLVGMIEWEKWSKVSFDINQKFAYTQGRHPSKPYHDQVPNPSHDDRAVIVYSWANTSGKTWWLQRDFIARRAAQTLWYAPVASGNFPKQYDLMVYLDRASTNAYAKRSAYMEEIHRIKNVLKQCQWKKALVYIDEPFSTTAPADQVGMIEILIEKIRANGWDVVIATHNEEAMKSLQNLYRDGMEIYHYDYAVERDPSWKPYIATHRTLKTGISDAHSIEVAEIQDAPTDIIERARSYLAGDMELSPFLTPMFPDIRRLSQTDRDWLVHREGLGNLYEGDDPRFHLYSVDWDFAEQWIGHNDIIHRPKTPKRVRYNKERDREHINVSLWNLVDLTEAHRLISQMLFASSTVPVWEILERQAMFCLLAQNHQYRAILHAVAGLADIEESFEAVSRWKDRVNHWLNPISIPRSVQIFWERLPRLTHVISYSKKKKKDIWQSEVNQAIAYIEMNKKMLKKESPPELMQLLMELRVYRSFIETYSDDTQFPIEIQDKNKKGGRYTTSYVTAFLDDSGHWNNLSVLLDILGHEQEKTEEEKQFIAAASEIFSPFMLAGFSSVRSIREYFWSLRQKVVDISHVLPKRWYEYFDTETMQDWLYGYADIIANDITGIDTSKRRTRGERGGFWFGFWEGIKSHAEDLTEDLLRISAWKKDFPKLRTILSKIESPYIQSALVFLEDQYNKLCQFSIEKEVPVVNRKHMRNQSSTLHVQKEQLFRHTFGGKKELGRYAFTGELDRLSALCIYSSYIAEWRLHLVTFNSTGEVRFPGNTNLLESLRFFWKDDEPIRWNDFILDAWFPYHVLTGPNGSGKTYYAKSGIVSVLQGLNTGYSQSRDATMPVFDRVIYFDRVNEQDGIHSSFASELEYWKEVWKVLESWARTLLFCDEMFSTVPPKYQAAFSHSIMHKALSTWTSFITASHHHDWVKSLMESMPTLPVSHLSFDIVDGVPIFHRALRSWHAPSHAKEVARKLWFF